MNTLHQPSNIFNIKSIHHIFFSAVIMLSLTVFAGCGSDSSTSAGGDPNPNNEGNEGPVENQGDTEVWMEGLTFNVSNLEVEAGTTVTWTNKSDMNHTVTSGSRGDADAGELFDSGSIAPGGIYSYTFEDAGAYAYFCDFHSGMDAEVTVTE